MTCISISVLSGTLQVKAANNEETSEKRKEVLNHLEESYVKRLATTPEAKEVYENIKRNSVGVTTSDRYIKFDEEQIEAPKICTEQEYILESKSNRNLKPNLGSESSISLKANSARGNLKSNSGNRYSWIKLTVEAYDFGQNNYMFCGFYEWLHKPWYTGSDVLTLGHDSSISFNTNTAHCFNQCEYWASPDNIYAPSIIESTTYNMKDDKENSIADTAGVGFKFPLTRVGDFCPAFYIGGIYCNGWLNNPYGGNLQVSYGHTQISAKFSLSGSITWLPSGGINFDVFGTQDLATHGDAVRA